MKVLVALLVSVGLVWGIQPLSDFEYDETSKEDDRKMSFTLGEPEEAKKQRIFFELVGDEINSKLNKENPIPDKPSTATETPVPEVSVPIDLSQRLFFANHQDSQRGRKTLDLSGLDLSGEDVMKILHGLNATTLATVARLDLSHNRVSRLPPRMWPLEMEYSLRELRLDYNQLNLYEPVYRKGTQFELLRLLSLKKLSLSHCGLTAGDSSDSEYPQVESLNLSGNRLVSLPYSLETLASLRHLDVSGNSLRYLSGSPLSSLSRLQTLNLSGNGLENVWDDPLQDMSFLETLLLDHNHLSEPPKVYEFKGSYQPRMNVTLGGNVFKCGCRFRNFLDNGRIHVVDNVNVKCEDEDGARWQMDAPQASRCSPNMEAVREKWAGTKEWFRDNRPDWSTLWRSLGWVFFGVTLGFVYAYRRAKKTPPPAQVPYNILDNGGC